MRLLTLFALLLVVSAATPARLYSQSLTRRERDVIDSVAKAELRTWRAPGLVLAIVRADSIVYLGSYGVANVETQEPISPEMMMSVASVSKLVTATTALVLIGQGKLDLTAPVRSYLPWINTQLGALTMSQLLSHTAGLGELTPDVSPEPNGAMAPVCKAMTAGAFVARPGDTWGYSSTGYTLAGCVIEAAGGRPFPEVVTQLVLGPLKMAHSTYNPRVAMTFKHAQGHDTRGEAPVLVRPFNSRPTIAPAGELITTVADLSRLARALLSDGMLDGQRALPAGLLKSLSTVRGHGGAFMGGERDHGFGLFSRSHRGLSILEHEGVYAGFGASFALAQDSGLAAIAITNGRFSSPVRTTQAGLEVAAGMRPLRSDSKSTRIAPADSAAALGRYASTRDTIELVALQSRLHFRRGTLELAISGRSEGHWEIPGFPDYAPLPAGPLELVRAGPAGSIAYVRLAWRIYRRVL